MLNYIEYLNIPTKTAIILVGFFLVLQIIGELLEFKGKAVPEYLKIRKYFKRKKIEKNEMRQTLKEVKQLLNDIGEVKQLLNDVNAHYSADNIAKRDAWMQWVNDRAEVYDNSIIEVGKISENLIDVTKALNSCTKMSEEMFVENSRDRIIDFAGKAGNQNSMVTREEFNRIFKTHKNYENFLEEHDMTNGEVDIAYRIIKESYEDHMKNHTFVEDIRGYNI